MKKNYHSKKHPKLPTYDHLYLTPRRKKRGMILRDNCKLYACRTKEQLDKYLKEKGLI